MPLWCYGQADSHLRDAYNGDDAIFYTNLQKLAELGFMGLNIRDEYGGTEAGVIAFSLAITEIARKCATGKCAHLYPGR